MRDSAIEMKWKVITAKKKDTDALGQVSGEKPKKESQIKAMEI
jgi:glutathione synthase/RimK-type ligase-like ATP-grasp enzyme